MRLVVPLESLVLLLLPLLVSQVRLVLRASLAQLLFPATLPHLPFSGNVVCVSAGIVHSSAPRGI